MKRGSSHSNVTVVRKRKFRSRQGERMNSRLRQTAATQYEPIQAVVGENFSIKPSKARLITVDRYGTMHINRPVMDSVTRLARSGSNKAGGMGKAIKKRKRLGRFSEPVRMADTETVMVKIGMSPAFNKLVPITDKDTGEKHIVRIKRDAQPKFVPVGLHESKPNSGRTNVPDTED